MEIKLLEHGFVRHVESWGYGDAKISEAGIIEAARQSTQGCFRGWDKDEKLLRFLHDNKHDSPFEFAGMVIEVQAPIFVFREWHRHRTQSYNEMSARYTELPDLYAVPALERCLMVNAASTNKQAGAVKDAPKLTPEIAEEGIRRIKYSQEVAEEQYQWLCKNGFEKGVARYPMPVSHYSRMRAQANLRNWLAFILLRADPAAQWEIREYANALSIIMADQFPRTWKLFAEGREKKHKLNSLLFTLKELAESPSGDGEAYMRGVLKKALQAYGI